MLDPERLKADLAAKADRMKGPLWAGAGGATEQDWSSLMTTAPASVVPPAPVHPSRLADAPRAATSLDDTPDRPASSFFRPAGYGHPVEMERGANTDWLQSVVGNPQDYDAPLDGRVNVCARLLPSTYLSVKRTKKQLGFRTIAGTWEYIIRLGLAAMGQRIQ